MSPIFLRGTGVPRQALGERPLAFHDRRLLNFSPSVWPNSSLSSKLRRCPAIERRQGGPGAANTNPMMVRAKQPLFPVPLARP